MSCLIWVSDYCRLGTTKGADASAVEISRRRHLTAAIFAGQRRGGRPTITETSVIFYCCPPAPPRDIEAGFRERGIPVRRARCGHGEVGEMA